MFNLFNVTLENLGTVNKNEVILKSKASRLSLYFSYSTIVAFDEIAKTGTRKKVACKNKWSKTTGKLLNEIEPNKKERVKYDRFNVLLRDAFVRFSRF